MDERKKYNIILADGATLSAIPDGAGNYIIDGVIDKDMFSSDNLISVSIADGNTVLDIVENQVLRTYYLMDNDQTFIRFGDMTELEKLEADYNAKLDYIACMTGVDLDE